MGAHCGDPKQAGAQVQFMPEQYKPDVAEVLYRLQHTPQTISLMAVTSHSGQSHCESLASSGAAESRKNPKQRDLALLGSAFSLYTH